MDYLASSFYFFNTPPPLLPPTFFFKEKVSSVRLNIYAFFQVMPISDFVSHCEATWMNMLLKSESGCGIIGAKSQLRSQTCEGISSYRSIRRILRPESLGVSLLGYLKVCK